MLAPSDFWNEELSSKIACIISHQNCALANVSVDVKIGGN